MTVQGNEPEGNAQGQNAGVNPAWESLMQHIPADIAHLVTPELKKWDDNFQQQVQAARAEAEPLKAYQGIVDGVDPEIVKGALYLAQQIQQDPGAVVEQMNQAYNLGFTKAELEQQAQQLQQQQDPYTPSWEQNDDITKHPAYQQLQQQVQQFQQRFDQEDQTREQQQAEQQVETYLGELEAEHGTFDRDYITALLSVGVSGDDAIARWRSIAGNTVSVPSNDGGNEQPPVVMGGEGTSGSGTPAAPVDMGAMSKGSTQDLVLQFLAQQQQNQQ